MLTDSWQSANPQITTDLLDLVASKAIWRSTFFSNDAGKGVQWREARDIMLQLFSGERERTYMRSLQQAGMIREVWVNRGRERSCSWQATEAWKSGNAVKSNPVLSRLKR